MNFQQLRSVREAVRQGYNLTDVAQALHTSQPGVSRQIRELEAELGVEIFVRAGKRLTGLTPPGEVVLPIVERLLAEADNLRRAGEDYAAQDRGTLVIAATHPQVALQMHQGSPHQVAQMLLAGEADIGVATEALAEVEGLVALPCYRWTHVVVVPHGHVLAREADARGAPLTLQRLADFPLITYEPGYTGRSHIDQAFARHGLRPDIVLAAMDADVIKTYVELGMGVGLVASIAHDEARDTGLRALDARHLFAASMTRLGLRRGAYLRRYAYEFIRCFAPPLTPELVGRAMQAAGDAEGFEI